MSVPPSDPRSRITPESFAIAPDLIGLPLARPSRRLLAILVDLVPVAIMANAGLAFFLAGLAAIAVWRTTGFLGRVKGVGVAVRALAALLVFSWVAQIDTGPWWNADMDEEESAAAMAAQSMRFVPEEYRTPEVELLLEDAAATSVDTVVGVPLAMADSVVAAYMNARRQGDSTAVEELRARAEEAIAGARINRLLRAQAEIRGELDAAVANNEELRDRIERMEEPRGIRRMLAGLADDLGIGFGWGALYFTTFLVLGRGQTPGKRLMGIRVIRLDGKPVGWWYAFERFGSYFASFTTGLVGFAQIYWDRNRQALHDKVVETVVIRVRKAPPVHVRTG